MEHLDEVFPILLAVVESLKRKFAARVEGIQEFLSVVVGVISGTAEIGIFGGTGGRRTRFALAVSSVGLTPVRAFVKGRFTLGVRGFGLRAPFPWVAM